MAFNIKNFQIIWTELSNNQNIPKISINYFENIPSTNQKLWELIDQEISPYFPLVAIASQQSSGKGQWGRKWQSEEGGLYLSLAINTNIPISNAAHLTLSSAYGVANILNNYNIPVFLKWPNDLILNKLKLGGIYTETRSYQDTIIQAVIGIGINYSNSVPENGINLKSFFNKNNNSDIDCLEMLAAITLKGLWQGYNLYLQEGIDAILPHYSKLLINIGQSVIFNGSSGIIVGVNSEGKLRVSLHSKGASMEICLQPNQISLGYDNI